MESLDVLSFANHRQAALLVRLVALGVLPACA